RLRGGPGDEIHGDRAGCGHAHRSAGHQAVAAPRQSMAMARLRSRCPPFAAEHRLAARSQLGQCCVHASTSRQYRRSGFVLGTTVAPGWSAARTHGGNGRRVVVAQDQFRAAVALVISVELLFFVVGGKSYYTATIYSLV